MFEKIKLVVHAIWAACAFTIGTIAGAAIGHQWHGVIGAIALGFVGLSIGAVAAAFPLECIGAILEGL